MTLKKQLRLTFSISFVFLLIMPLILANSFVSTTDTAETKELEIKYPITSYVSSSTMIKINDTTILTYKSDGDGSVGNPFLVKDINVITSQSIGIMLSELSYHIILENCTTEGNSYGIYLDNLDSGVAHIRNCTAKGDRAIGGINSNNITIYNNTLYTSSEIDFYISNYLNMSKNVLTSQIDGYNILKVQGVHCVFSDNIIHGRGSSLIFGGQFHCSSAIITGNILYNCGFEFIDATSYIKTITFQNNLLNNKPVALLIDQQNTIIDNNNFGQFILVNASDVTLEDLDISSTNFGIQLIECTNTVIRDSYLMTFSGVKVLNSEFIVIDKCNFTVNQTGIVVYTSNNITIRDNYIRGYLGLILDTITDCWLIHNFIDNATYSAFEIYYIENLLATRNIFVTYLTFDEGNSIATLESLTNATFYMNIYINSGTYAGTLIIDEPGDTAWYNDEILLGNYYSDWNGTDPYWIPSSGAHDLYPMNDTDGDFLNETEEVMIYHTDPFSADSDDDTISDYDEIFVYMTNPNDEDTDGDGATDEVELQSGTDPNDPLDFPKQNPNYTWIIVLIIVAGAAIVVVGVLYKKGFIQNLKRKSGSEVEPKSSDSK